MRVNASRFDADPEDGFLGDSASKTEKGNLSCPQTYDKYRKTKVFLFLTESAFFKMVFAPAMDPL